MYRKGFELAPAASFGFFFFLAVLLGRNLIRNLPLFEIRDDGVYLPSKTLLIPWSNIFSANIEKFGSNEMVAVVVRNPDLHAKQLGWMARMGVAKNKIVLGSPRFSEFKAEFLVSEIENRVRDYSVANASAGGAPLEAPVSIPEVPEIHIGYGRAMPVIFAVNILFFILMWIKGVDPVKPEITDLMYWGANSGTESLGGEYWRLLTSTFIHIGFIHLLLNMFALWQVGRFVETFLGSFGFLVVYISTGLAGSLVSSLFQPAHVVSAGASGAVFGLYGSLIAVLIKNHVKIPKDMMTALVGSVAVFLVYNFRDVKDGVDIFAHLGGLVFGLPVAFLLRFETPSEESKGEGFFKSRLFRSLWVGALACTLVFGIAFLVPPPKTLPDHIMGLQDLYGQVQNEIEGFDEAKPSSDQSNREVLERTGKLLDQMKSISIEMNHVKIEGLGDRGKVMALYMRFGNLLVKSTEKNLKFFSNPEDKAAQKEAEDARQELEITVKELNEMNPPGEGFTEEEDAS